MTLAQQVVAKNKEIAAAAASVANAQKQLVTLTAARTKMDQDLQVAGKTLTSTAAEIKKVTAEVATLKKPGGDKTALGKAEAKLKNLQKAEKDLNTKADGLRKAALANFEAAKKLTAQQKALAAQGATLQQQLAAIMARIDALTMAGVLGNAEEYAAFHVQCKAAMSDDQLEFMKAVHDNVALAVLIARFVQVGSPKEVNIPSKLRDAWLAAPGDAGHKAAANREAELMLNDGLKVYKKKAKAGTP